MSQPQQITFAPAGSAYNVEVSSACPWNVDGTRLLLLASTPPAILDHFALFTGDGQYLADTTLGASMRPRWSRTDPDLLTYISGNSLKSWSASRAASTLIHTFAEYEALDDRGEADTQGDSRVLCGTRPDGQIEVFVFNMKTGVKGPSPSQVDAFDGLKLTAGLRAILSRGDGIWATNSGHQVTTASGHACPTQYLGRDKLLWFNSNESPITLPGFKNGAVMVDVETRAQTGLISFPQKNAKGDGWAYSVHVSACDLPVGLVSAYAPDGSLPCQLWLTPFDGSGVKKIVGDTGGKIRDYTSQPRAALSRDGSKAVFNVDSGDAVNVWMVQVADNIAVNAVQTPPPPNYGTKIDYAPFAGKSVFTMVPRADGGVDLYERKL